MKKQTVLAAALVVLSGAAYATDAATTATGDTLGSKARRGAQQVGESFKQMGRDARNVARDIANPNDRQRAVRGYNDTGYAGSASAETDAARRQRMDAAYANWQSKR